MFNTVVVFAACVSLAFGAPQTPKSAPELDGRIVGGRNADINDYPWTASLQYRYGHYCGSAIISSTVVLTAAHCIIGYPLSAFSIRAGATDHNFGGQIIPAARIIAHAEYDSATADYDIAVVELVAPITISNASPIRLAPSGSGPVAGATAAITGWGLLSEGGNVPVILQVIEVPVVSQVSCRFSYGTLLTDRMFCAGLIAGGKDACRGDSGGPLVVDGYLTGLVSWGTGCARPNYPGVYANLPVLRSWITANTGI